MTSSNRVLRSPDPVDRTIDPADQFQDPADQLKPFLPDGIAHQHVEALIAPQEIKALRERLRVTQRQFAGWFGFSAATLRHWERGNRRPTGSALVLLCVIRENPRVVIQAVRKARQMSGRLPETEPLKSYRAPPTFGRRRPREVDD